MSESFLVELYVLPVEKTFPYRDFKVDDYAQCTRADERPLIELLEEYRICRTSTQMLFRTGTQEMLTHTGVASGHSISVRALGLKLIGHDLHHCQALQERYL